MADLHMRCSDKFMDLLNDLKRNFRPMIELAGIAPQMCQVEHILFYIENKSAGLLVLQYFTADFSLEGNTSLPLTYCFFVLSNP